jgi:hypothetical protein
MVENVLLVTVDSLRYDAWRELQPDLTAGPRLERGGATFDWAFATGPGTTPSFPALLTGTMPLSYGGLGPLSTERPRVAADLRDRGFATGGFHSNPYLSGAFDYDVGFDAFEDYQNPLMGVATRLFPRGIEINNPRLERLDDVLNLTGLLKTAYRQVSGKARPYVDAEVITDDTIAWLETTEGPFFGWAHYMDVHHPCHPPRRFRETFSVGEVDTETVSALYSRLIRDPDTLTEENVETLLGLYRAAIQYVDHQVSRLLRVLRESGRYEDTLVVFTSELLRVPLVVTNAPDSLCPTGELVSLLDVPPLWQTALGESVPAQYEGVVPGQDARSFVVAEHEVEGDAIVGVRSRNWLYERDDIRDARRLFELGSMRRVDPEMATDREARVVLRAGESRMSEIQRAGVAQDGETDRGELGSDVEARLEELGYR